MSEEGHVNPRHKIWVETIKSRGLPRLSAPAGQVSPIFCPIWGEKQRWEDPRFAGALIAMRRNRPVFESMVAESNMGI